MCMCMDMSGCHRRRPVSEKFGLDSGMRCVAACTPSRAVKSLLACMTNYAEPCQQLINRCACMKRLFDFHCAVLVCLRLPVGNLTKSIGHVTAASPKIDRAVPSDFSRRKKWKVTRALSNWQIIDAGLSTYTETQKLVGGILMLTRSTVLNNCLGIYAYALHISHAVLPPLITRTEWMSMLTPTQALAIQSQPDYVRLYNAKNRGDT